MNSNPYHLGLRPSTKGHTISESSEFFSVYVDEAYKPQGVGNVNESQRYLIANPALWDGRVEAETVTAYLNGHTEVLNLVQESPENVLEEERNELTSRTNSVFIAEEAEEYEEEYLAFHANLV